MNLGINPHLFELPEGSSVSLQKLYNENSSQQIYLCDQKGFRPFNRTLWIGLQQRSMGAK